MILNKRMPTPFPEARQKLDDALWEYYELCFPEFDEDERYDLTRDVLIQVEQTISRLCEDKGKK